ncbi:MAG TPA: cytochrome c biogenesis protein DipZ [Rhizobacter sp.]|nr:cytochrome c biogenesis protein DipZ [Rhizobacter sp.]
MLQLVLAGAAGVATVASPCVLPMLPLLLGATLGGGARAARSRPFFIVLGFVLAFSATALLFGSSVRVLGVSQEALRTGAIGVLWVFGALLLWPALFERVMAPLGGLADWASQRGMAPGAWGGFGLGLTLGLLWTPCAGPVLASILALIAAQPDSTQAGALLLAYSLGSALPMLAIAYGGQAVLQRARALARHAGRIRQGFGVMVLAVASAMYGGWDTAAAAWVADAVTAPATARQQEAPPVEAAPDFTGITTWFNSPALTMHDLRGKVVLVDFWTYACVNCVRTLPYLARWHERYAEQGLVIVGVHTPEFSFERETAHLQAAIERHGIRYPVAQDNAYRTWSAYRNQYWPAVYLIDREGRVVFRHVGDTDQETVERQIQEVLRR